MIRFNAILHEGPSFNLPESFYKKKYLEWLHRFHLFHWLSLCPSLFFDTCLYRIRGPPSIWSELSFITQDVLYYSLESEPNWPLFCLLFKPNRHLSGLLLANPRLLLSPTALTNSLLLTFFTQALHRVPFCPIFPLEQEWFITTSNLIIILPLFLYILPCLLEILLSFLLSFSLEVFFLWHFPDLNT